MNKLHMLQPREAPPAFIVDSDVQIAKREGYFEGWNDAVDIYLEAVSQPVTVDSPEIDKAAQCLAKLFDYPWEYMTEQGRENMRLHALTVWRTVDIFQRTK